MRKKYTSMRSGKPMLSNEKTIEYEIVPAKKRCNAVACMKICSGE